MPKNSSLLESSRELVLHDHGMPWYRLLLQRDIAFLGLQYFGFSYTWYFYVTWLPTWLQRVHGLTKLETAGYAMLPLALGGVGSIVSGLLPLSIPRKFVAIGGFAATGILILIIPSVQNVNVAMALMAMASFSSDLTMPISWNTCVEIGKQYTATVSSTMNMLGNAAGFVAPLLGGIILDHTNSRTGTWFFAPWRSRPSCVCRLLVLHRPRQIAALRIHSRRYDKS